MLQVSSLILAFLLSFLGLRGEHPFVPGLISLLLLTSLLLARRPFPAIPANSHKIVILPGLLLFVLWYGLSTLWSAAPADTLNYLMVIGGMLLSALVAANISTRNWNRLAWLLGITATAMALYAIYQAVSIDGVLRQKALFLHPNQLAGFLLLFCLPAAAAILSKPERKEILLPGSALVLFITALTLTQSRGAIIALLAGLILLGFISRPWRKQSFMAIALLVATGILAGSVLNSGMVGSRFASTLGTASLDSPLSPNPRTAIWESALGMYSDRPILGWGGGSFKLAYPAFRPPAFSPEIFNAHNDYLQVLVELGPAGLFILLVTLSATLYSGIRSSHNNGKEAPLNAGMTSALMALCTQLLVTSSLYTLPITIIIGIYIGRLASGNNADDNVQTRSNTLSAILIKGVITLLIFHVGSMQISKYFLLQSLKETSLTKRLSYLHSAARWNPVDDIPHYFRAKLLSELIQQGQIDRNKALLLAQHELDQAEKLMPLRRQTYWLRANLLQQQRPLPIDAIEKNYRTTLKLNPKFLLARIEYARFLQQQERGDAACRLLQAGMTERYYAKRTTLITYTQELKQCQNMERLAKNENGRGFEDDLKRLQSNPYDIVFYSFH